MVSVTSQCPNNYSHCIQ